MVICIKLPFLFFFKYAWQAAVDQKAIITIPVLKPHCPPSQEDGINTASRLWVPVITPTHNSSGCQRVGVALSRRCPGEMGIEC